MSAASYRVAPLRVQRLAPADLRGRRVWCACGGRMLLEEPDGAPGRLVCMLCSQEAAYDVLDPPAYAPPAPILPPTERWSRRWEVCRSCHRTDRPHHAYGYCAPCRDAERRSRHAYEKRRCRDCTVAAVEPGRHLCGACRGRRYRERQEGAS